MDKNTLGYKIKFYRTKKRLTQKELAEIVGYSDNTSIQRIEHNEYFPPLDKLFEIAKALDVAVNDLATDYITKLNTDFVNITDELDLFYHDINVSEVEKLEKLMKLLESYAILKNKKQLKSR